MNVLEIILLVIHITVSLGLVIAVLLHSGSGGGLSSVLGGGGGGGGSMFSGSHIVEKNLDRITIVLGVTFAITTLLLVWMIGTK